MKLFGFRLFGVAIACAACGASGGKKAAVMHKPVELPVAMVENRFLLETTTSAGAPLRIYLDSAGANFLTRRAVDWLKLSVKHEPSAPGAGAGSDTVEFPKFFDARLPRPQLAAFAVLEESTFENADGMLGGPWFAGRVFTFDYADKSMLFRAPGDVPNAPAAHRIPLVLRRDAAGEASSPYGRIQIDVDGAPLQMLLDTGATVTLAPEARQALGGAAVQRATSFITPSVFERWRQGHPEWRVIEPADVTLPGTAMIEVPEVRIAGHAIGPVWFTRRVDREFVDYMEKELGDTPSDGAIGGSALRHFQRVTVDWANAVAVFEK